jgi:RHS repeat-associated protein
VTLTATPASGYVFVGWSGTGCPTGTVQMSQATTCTATFGHRLTVSARLKNGSPYRDVQWTSTPAGINCWTGCAANFASGTVVTLTTSEGPSSWSGDCSMRQSLTMDGDKTCIAIFNNYLGPIRLGAEAPTSGSATNSTANGAPQPDTAAPAGESGPAATSSAVESAGLGASVVATSMDTATTLQAVEYYHLDALGSVRALTDAQGQVLRRHDFRPFGEELAPQTPPKDRKLFTGQERDFETGLDYFYARQLRVDLGRFTATDPMADFAWTDPVVGASNAYAYVGGNPLGFIDPSGAQGEQIVVHPNWWDRFLGWLSGPLVFRSGVEVCISCNSSPGPSSLVGGITGSAGTVGFGSSEPSYEPRQQSDQPKKPSCTKLQKMAGDLGSGFEDVSTVSGTIAFGTGVGTLAFGLGEGPSAGVDTPATLTLGAITETMISMSVLSGATAATLESYASGNTSALERFNISQLANLAATAGASKVPFIRKWADRIGDLVEQATALGIQAQEGCR